MGKVKEFINYEETKRDRIIILAYLIVFLIVGLSLQSFDDLLAGLKLILLSPAGLITDYVEIGGVGPTLVNAAFVSLIGFFFLNYYRSEFKGITIAAVFTMLGFAFLGKNFLSIWPIISGVLVYSFLTGHSIKDNLPVALFGTTLAPIVTESAFGYGWGIGVGIGLGFLAGLVIAAVSNHVFSFHEGYSLYNVGFSCGIIATIFYAFFVGFGYEKELHSFWGHDDSTFLSIFILLICLSMILLGLIVTKGSVRGLKKIFDLDKNVSNDCIACAGMGTSLINMGLVGIVGILFLLIVDAPFNGPSIGGILTMIGFGANGKHPKNMAPIMAGVITAAFLSTYELNAPAVVLAGLFGNTLAPLSGKFGGRFGFVAGFMHLFLVSRVSLFNGGLNLYNNGFAGGIIVGIIISISKDINQGPRLKNYRLKKHNEKNKSSQ